VAKDQYGNEIRGIAFTWSSANPGTATVTEAGLATGVAPGTTAINASAQGVLGNGSVLTVVRPASVLNSITATPTTASVQAGNTLQFTVVGFDHPPHFGFLRVDRAASSRSRSSAELELICVDDGSPDKSREILADLQSQHSDLVCDREGLGGMRRIRKALSR